MDCKAKRIEGSVDEVREAMLKDFEEMGVGVEHALLSLMDALGPDLFVQAVRQMNPDARIILLTAVLAGITHDRMGLAPMEDDQLTGLFIFCQYEMLRRKRAKTQEEEQFGPMGQKGEA